jgi:hypothetical protein
VRVLEQHQAECVRDVFHVAAFVRRHERDGGARRSGATGPADPVDVRLAVERHFEVDDRLDGVDVEAAGGDVGGDEHAVGARLEPFDRPQSIGLRAVGMQRGGTDARRHQLARQPVGTAFGGREHQGRAGRAPQIAHQPGRLLVAAKQLRLVRDRRRRRVADAQLHQLGRAHDLQREAHDFLGHRRGEEQRLPRSVGGQLRDDELHVRPEAHVQHAVRLVEHEDVEAGELGDTRAQVVHQPARRGDDDVDAGLEGLLLHVHADAAEDGGAAHRRVVPEPLDVVLDLDGEFARRREHEDAGRALARRVALEQPLHQWQQERRGLAGTGLGTGHQVVADHDGVEDGALDGRRLLEPPVLDAHDEVGLREEVGELAGLDVGRQGLELRQQLGVTGGGLRTCGRTTRTGPAAAGPGASFRTWTHSLSSVRSSVWSSIGSATSALLADTSSNSTVDSRSSSSSYKRVTGRCLIGPRGPFS